MTIFIKYKTSLKRINSNFINLSKLTQKETNNKFKDILKIDNSLCVIDFDNFRYFISNHFESIVKYILSKDKTLLITFKNYNTEEKISWDLKGDNKIYTRKFLSYLLPFKIKFNNDYKITFKGNEFNYTIYYFSKNKTLSQIKEKINTNYQHNLHFYYECRNVTTNHYNFLKTFDMIKNKKILSSISLTPEKPYKSCLKYSSFLKRPQPLLNYSPTPPSNFNNFLTTKTKFISPNSIEQIKEINLIHYQKIIQIEREIEKYENQGIYNLPELNNLIKNKIYDLRLYLTKLENLQ